MLTFGSPGRMPQLLKLLELRSNLLAPLLERSSVDDTGFKVLMQGSELLDQLCLAPLDRWCG